MNSLNVKNKLKAAFIAASAAVLAAGCSSTHHHAHYHANQAPLAMTDQSGEAMGGTGASTEIQTGGGSSAQAANVQSGENIVIPLQQEQLRVGTQKTDAGSVRLRKTVTTETVYQPVQVRREQLSLERLPANAQASANQGAAPQFSGSQSGGSQAPSGQANAGGLGTPFQEGEMTINLSKEQAVAQTEVVPAGSVVVHKQTITEPVNIQRQVRRENVQAITPSGSNLISPANEASGAAPSASGQSSGAGGSSGAAITQLSQLSGASDKTSLAGQQVNLSDAKVQQVVGDRLITIMAPDGTAIFVRTAQPVTSLTSGQKVSVNGMVRQTPQAASSSLGLDEKSSQALQGQQIFIDANSVTPSNQ